MLRSVNLDHESVTFKRKTHKNIDYYVNTLFSGVNDTFNYIIVDQDVSQKIWNKIKIISVTKVIFSSGINISPRAGAESDCGH